MPLGNNSLSEGRKRLAFSAAIKYDVLEHFSSF